MHGNVWEWCLDNWHDNYQGVPIDGSALLLGSEIRKVRRGGSWFNRPAYCRSAYRLSDLPRYDYFNVGFRVVCSAPRTP